MIVKIFAIRDAKADAFLQPFFSPTKGTAIRAFSDAVNDSQSQFFKYPDDFTLFELGTFNDSTGGIELLKQPLAIGNSLEFKREIAA
jgi:hypothetical protein